MKTPEALHFAGSSDKIIYIHILLADMIVDDRVPVYLRTGQ